MVVGQSEHGVLFVMGESRALNIPNMYKFNN